MADVCDARRGRGAGNGGNANWFNSPLWASIDAKKGKTNTESKEQSVNQETKLDDLDLKARQRKMYALAY